MQKFYCILSALALFGILFPKIALILIFVLGLGFVILIAPSLWLYVTCAIPGWFLWRKKQKPLLGSLLSFAGILAFATMPPYIASLKSQDLIAQATASDFNQLDSSDLSNQQIVIFEKVERLRAPFAYGGEYNVPCLRLCQRLLLDDLGGKRGIFVAVQGKVHRRKDRQFQNKGSYYRLENRPHCSQRHAGNVFEIFNETIELAVNHGKCIVRYSSSVIPDGLIFDENMLQDDEFIPRSSLAYATRTKRLEVFKLTGEHRKLLLRATSVRIRKATYPTLIIPSSSVLHAVTALPFFSTFDQKENLNIVDVVEEISEHNLRKNPSAHRYQNNRLDKLYFELGKSRHQLPAEFIPYFKTPADEFYIAP